MNRLAIAVVALLSASACKKTVDSSGFEKTLDGKLRGMGFTPTMVKCAKGVEAKVGAKFTCQVEIEKTTYDVNAQITSVDKESKRVELSTTWAKGEAMIAKVIVEHSTKAVGEAVGAPVTVDCGKEPLLWVQDGKVTCKATAGTTTADLILDVNDKLQVTGWHLDKILLKKKLEDSVIESVRSQSSPTATVTCGSEPILQRPEDGNVPCDVTVGGETRKIRIVVAPDLKIEKWEAVPAS